jgi:hypothetical protein
MVRSETQTPEARALGRARYLTGLLWHLGAFVIINGFFWLIDATLGAEGIQWAYWITGVWGFALAFHVLAYLVAGRQVESRRAERYLAEQDRHRTT